MSLYGFVRFVFENTLLFRVIIDAVNREGKYAVITGGNRGIGWYTVKGLVASGMKVVVGKAT